MMQPGYQIDHYRIIEQIGQGGQATVWSADDERLKRVVAIKTINRRDGNAGDSATIDSDVAHRFQDEAHIIADLEHPAILPIYTFGQDGDALYIIMRYMAGGSLKQLIHESGQLEPQDIVRMAQPLADALDLAHQRQIVHRDIKSANVLLDARQNLYLADFGLSVTLGESNQQGGGTLNYMSPEQIMEDPYDHRADLYAFGILLYEMLTGATPTVDGQPWNVQQVMSNAPLPVPQFMPAKIGDVLRKATAMQPDARYQTATAMIKALADCITPDAASVPGAAAVLPPTDPALLALFKANNMFTASLEDWADGAGRFRFYADDFRYVDSYYSDADLWDIPLDAAAHRLMLRGALEHGQNIDLWWDSVADVSERRAIALQTLSSELPDARLRAITALQRVPDSDPPAIPARVGNLLTVEKAPTVKRAGLALLNDLAAKSGANPSTNPQWRPVAFSENLDGTIADLAAHDPDAQTAEAAARLCARMRSLYAMDQLGKAAAAGEHRAIGALSYARDEVPALPSVVPASVRRDAFLMLTRRQLLAPGLVGRYLGAALGFVIGWGVIQYLQYNGRDLIPLQAAGNAAASGVLYSLLVGLSVVAAAEPAQRLRAWTTWGRIGLSWLLGAGLCMVAFLTLRRYYYFNVDPPDVPWLALPSLLFPAGFAIASGLTRHTWLRSIAGVAGVLLAIYLSWKAYMGEVALDSLIFFQQDNQALVLSAGFAIAVGVGAFLPEIVRGFWRFTQGNTVNATNS